MTDTISKVLNTALEIVGKDRSRTHGDPEDNLTQIAELWGVYLGCAISPFDVCQMMVLSKVSRSKVGNPHNLDHYVDQAGYSALSARMAIGLNIDEES